MAETAGARDADRPGDAADVAAGTEDEGTSPRRASLLKSSAIMASGTLVSRMLGFVKMMLLVVAIGSVAGVADSFAVADTLPNTVYNLLAAGVFDAVLVPQIVRALKSKSGQTYVNRLLTVAGLILFVVTVVVMILAPLLVTILAGGFDGPMRQLTIAFTLICLPQIFFYGLYNLLGELLNARGIFGPYMWAPVLNNIIGIAGIVVFIAMFGRSPGDTLPIEGFTSTQMWVLAGSATLGVICQALILLWPIRRYKVALRPDFHFRGTSFGSASKVAGWTFATLAVSQIGVISTTQLASRAAAVADTTGALLAGTNAYKVAFMVYMVPQSLFTVSIATVIFTRLANAVAEKQHKVVAENYERGIRMITMVCLMCAAILMAGAVPMMQMVIPSQSVDAVQSYAYVLFALMPGVASTGMVLMSQRIFFAYEDAKPVFLMGLVPTALQLVVGWTIFFTTDALWWTAGGALAETVCRVTQGFIGVFWVANRVRAVNPGRIIANYVKYLIAALFAFGAGVLALHFVGPMTDGGTAVNFTGAALKLVLVSIVCVAAFLGILKVWDPVNTNRTILYMGRRLHVPAGALRLLVGARAFETAMANTAAAEAESESDEAGADAPDLPDGAEPVAADASAESEQTGDTFPHPDEPPTDSGSWATLERGLGGGAGTYTGEVPIINAGVLGGAPRPGLPSFDEIVFGPDAPSHGRRQWIVASEDDEEGTSATSDEPGTQLGEGAATLEAGAGSLTALDDRQPTAEESETVSDEDAMTNKDSEDFPDDTGQPTEPADEALPVVDDDRDDDGIDDADESSMEAGSDDSDFRFDDTEREADGSLEIPFDDPEADDGADGADDGDAAGATDGTGDDDGDAGSAALPAAAGAAGAAAVGAAAAGPVSDVVARVKGWWSGLSKGAPAPTAPGTDGATGPSAGSVDAALPWEDDEDDTQLPDTAADVPGSAPILTTEPLDSTTVDELADDAETPADEGTDDIAPDGDNDQDESADDRDENADGESAFAAEDVDGEAAPADEAPYLEEPPAPTSEDLTASAPAATEPDVLAPPPPAPAEISNFDAVIAPPSAAQGAGASAGQWGGSSNAAPGPAGPGNGRIDPTKPTVIFAALLCVLGLVFAGTTLARPVVNFDLSGLPGQGQSGGDEGESGADASAKPSAKPTKTPSAAPVITGATVLSWNDDGGDHPDQAQAMIDGNPETIWNSRWFESGFAPGTEIMIVLNLQQKAKVSEFVVLAEGSGGSIRLSDVDPDNPRAGGTELATFALSEGGETHVKIDPPKDATNLALTFVEMPTDADGALRAVIKDVGVY